MPKICICVDDYGLHQGINQAALSLLDRGRISAISCLVEGPAWGLGRKALRERAHQIEIGLHLNFTESFGKDRKGRSLRSLIMAAYAHRLDARAFALDIRRQMERFEMDTGQMPDFVDGHQHVHQLPVIREAVVEALDGRYKGRKPWVRGSCPLPFGTFETGISTWWKLNLIGMLGGPALVRLLRAHGYRHNRRLLGVYGFDVSEAVYLRLLRSWLESAEDGDLLMCHPSLPGRWEDPLLKARHREYRVLSGDEWDVLLRSADIRIAPLAHWSREA